MVLEKISVYNWRNWRKKDPVYILSSTGHCLYYSMSNLPLAYVWRIQRMPNVSSVCLAYDESMRNVLSIRSISLKHYFSLCVFQGTPTYNSVWGTYTTYALRTPNVYLRIRDDHTLAYADVIRCGVTALFNGHSEFFLIHSVCVALTTAGNKSRSDWVMLPE